MNLLSSLYLLLLYTRTGQFRYDSKCILYIQSRFALYIDGKQIDDGNKTTFLGTVNSFTHCICHKLQATVAAQSKA